MLVGQHISDGSTNFLSFQAVVILLTAWALFELVLDKTDKIGNRTGALGLIFRVVTGSVSGAAVYVSAGGSLLFGALMGLTGAMLGTFGGFYSRKAILKKSTFSGFSVAIAEDTLAVALGLAFMCLAARFYIY